jgi:vancomycin resistance protein YoaR
VPATTKHRRKPSRISPLFLIGGLVVLFLAVYGIVRLGTQGQVLGSVAVLDVDLGGATPETALAALVELEERLATRPAPVRVEGATVELLPVQAGFDLDEEAIINEALMVGRSPNPVSNFFWWISHLGRTVEVDPQASLDDESVEELLMTLDKSLIGEPPFEGGISVVNGELTAEYPRPGRRIDREQAPALLTGHFLENDRNVLELPVRNERPLLTEADVDAARNEASLMLSAPVLLMADDGTTLTFGVEDLRRAFVATPNASGFDLGFDVSAVETRLADVRSEFEASPVNARFEISGYEVSIIPGSNGTLIDGKLTAEILAEAAHTSVRRAALPLEEGAEPEVTTGALEALDIGHLVAQFTTYHDCCAARVTNIHLIADEVDGAIVPSGATFSLNEHVGRRTEEEGYLDAGTIVGGEIVDTVGGGVSQFATTFYNAVFWGGYEDVDHSPHSFYFERYPEGIEATISWPNPDLVFRNNDDSGVLIKTEYTDTSITVKFYGNNEGRILTGSQNGGSLSVGVVAEGGSNAKQVRGDRSDRRDFREPPEPLYRANPELAVDEQHTVQSAAQGWSLTVTRTITMSGEATTQEWPVRYLAKQEIIEVHPCKVPDGGVACPTTTTTTVTTVPPETTTVPTTTPSTEPTTAPTTSTTVAA